MILQNVSHQVQFWLSYQGVEGVEGLVVELQGRHQMIYLGTVSKCVCGDQNVF